MKSQPRKICVVTGTRAEYGLLFWLLTELRKDPRMDLQLVATGMHLCKEYGQTERFILQDGFQIDARVDMMVSGDSASSATKSIGLGVIGFGDCFERLKPDVLVVLGDRYEVFAAAAAAMIYRIPIAHIHGGEATEGLIDEAIRHSITKMAHIHFTAAADYRKRVIQLGEQPQSVFNVGAVGLEWMHRTSLLSKAELSAQTGLSFADKNILLVFHPETLNADSGLSALEEILKALAERSENIFISASNADPGGQEISARLKNFLSLNPKKRFFFESLGHKNFLSLLKNVDLIMGNSSSGILEAPALHTPTLNIGNRQQGRLRASSVIDCPAIKESLEKNISKLLSEPQDFDSIPYGDGRNASLKMTEVLASTDLSSILCKKFFDQ